MPTYTPSLKHHQFDLRFVSKNEPAPEVIFPKAPKLETEGKRVVVIRQEKPGYVLNNNQIEQEADYDIVDMDIPEITK